MEYQEYLNQKKEMYNVFIQFLENESEFDEGFTNLQDLISKQNILEDKEELASFIRMIVKISNYHQHHPNFYAKIKQIIQYLSESIKQYFKNQHIFDIFKSNKSIILYLIEEKILIIDQEITKAIVTFGKYKNNKYHFFFYPEIKDFLCDEDLKSIEKKIHEKIEDFNKKRHNGENDSYICEIVRKDSIDEFVIYVNKTNLSLRRTKINESIFETNEYLIKKRPTLIEYAAFYGSIQIFQYLRFNQVELNSDLWLYVIHSKNAELIHLLEENHVMPPNGTYESCFFESIKCHHNDTSIYIRDNLLDIKNNDELLKNEQFFKIIFKSYNYKMIENDFKGNHFFFYLNKYHHSKLVYFYVKPQRDKIIRECKMNSYIIQFNIFIKSN